MSLTINFENNITGEDDVTGLATGDHASETLGINIYSQIFKRKDAFDAAVKVEDRADLLKILKKVVKCETGKELGYREQVSTYFDNVALEKVASASTESNTYLMQPNQILIFQSKQGPEDTPYYTYYCYFKENAVETATGESKDGNVWVIYIPGPKMSPIVFDLVDSLEPTFEIAGTLNSDGTSGGVQSVSTGNFVLRRKQNNAGIVAWENKVDLKNTSFNLAYDDMSEGQAEITFYGVVVAENTPTVG